MTGGILVHAVKPYSYGISITWGPHVIWKLPPNIDVLCGAFAQ